MAGQQHFFNRTDIIRPDEASDGESLEKLNQPIADFAREKNFSRRDDDKTTSNHLEIMRPARASGSGDIAWNDNWHRLRVTAFRMSRGIEIIGKKKRLCRRMENVFSGQDAVEWLVADSDNMATTPAEAINLGQQLLNNGFIYRVSSKDYGYSGRYGKHKRKVVFKGGEHYYRFNLENICPRNLYVIVAGARNLKRMDMKTNNDPYVELEVGHQKKRSSVIMNDAWPTWRDEINVFGITDPLSEHLRVRVMDYDLFKKDDFIGKCEVSISDVYQAPDASHLQEQMQRWREETSEGGIQDGNRKDNPLDRGWIEIYDQHGKQSGQVRLALVLRDFEGRDAEMFKSTVQPYTLHCHVFGVEGVKERGGNWDMWLGRKMGIAYNARVEVRYEKQCVKTPWVRKRKEGDAEWPKPESKEGVPLLLDIESNVVIGKVHIVVMQKLPTDQDITAHHLAALTLPLEQVPIIYNFEGDEGLSPRRQMAKTGTPVPIASYAVTDGASNKYDLDVQNGRVRAAIWMEMRSNNVLGPMQDEVLAREPFKQTVRLHRDVVHEGVPVGLERLYKAIASDSCFIFHVLYDEMLYQRIQVEPWVAVPRSEDRYSKLEMAGLSAAILSRKVRYTICGVTHLGRCRVEERHTILDKTDCGFVIHIETNFLEMPFSDKFREHTLITVYQNRSDPYWSHVHVTSEVDVAIDGGPPPHLQAEYKTAHIDRQRTTFITFVHIIQGACLGSKRAQEKKKMQHAREVTMVLPTRLSRRSLFIVLLRCLAIVAVTSIAVVPAWAGAAAATCPEAATKPGAAAANAAVDLASASEL
mmetsp:Transcript_3151/g.8983  ORF Transcript_3151/g.8983 Transcript_3151/m.8983 type:complete len:811 (-) Transcript_3151:141-2573(-)